MSTTNDQAAKSTRKSLIVRFAPIAVIFGGLAFGYTMGWHEFLSLDYLVESRDMLTEMVAAHYLTAVFGFIAVYALATAFSFPAASILTIFA